MEKKLIAMAREMEKLRAEIANAEKRSRATAAAAAAAGNPGIQLCTCLLYLLCGI
jgi:hypothetical protein